MIHVLILGTLCLKASMVDGVGKQSTSQVHVPNAFKLVTCAKSLIQLDARQTQNLAPTLPFFRLRLHRQIGHSVHSLVPFLSSCSIAEISQEKCRDGMLLVGRSQGTETNQSGNREAVEER